MKQTGPTVNLELIRKAQQGQETSQSRLAELTEQKIFTFIYRTTLEYHLSQDLCQETLLEMVRSLPKTDFAQERAFWAWLYRVALSKVHHQFRKQGHNRISQQTQSDSDLLSHCEDQANHSGLERLLRNERVQAVTRAMQSLRPQERSILSLRCFEDLSYAEIASVTGRTQIASKLAFFRAKQSLKRQLVRKGFGSSTLGAALGTFALITDRTASTTQAMGLIKGTSLQVGPLVTIVGSLTTKLGVFLVSLFSLGVCSPLIVDAYLPTPPLSAAQPIIGHVSGEQFVLPTKVVDSYHPHQEGLLCEDKSKQSFTNVGQGQQLLSVLKPENHRYLVIRHQFWLELEFGKTLVDGPGPDIYLGTWGCTQIRLFVSKGEEVHELIHLPCNLDHHNYHILPFDLKDAPFPVKSLRIVKEGSSIPGLQLHTICARISQTEE